MKRSMWAACALLVPLSACDLGDRGQMLDAPLPAPADAAPDAAPDAAQPPGLIHRGTIIVAEQHHGDTTSSSTRISIPVDQLFGGIAATAERCAYFPSREYNQSAGTVTFLGLNRPLRETALTDLPPVTYSASGAGYRDLFAADASITFIASGHPLGVPTFSGTTRAPAPIANAVLPDALSRAAPPTLTWQADPGPAEIWVWIVAPTPDPDHDALLWCRIPDAGTYAPPAAALALLPSGATSATVTLWRASTTTAFAGELPVDLTVADAVTGDPIPLGP